MQNGAHILWKVELKGGLTHSPAISPNGHLYCSCNDGRLYAFDRNGNILWTYQWDPKPRGHSRGNHVMVTSTGRIVLSGLTDSPEGNRYGDLTRLMVLSSSGQLEWQMSFKGDGACSQAEASDGTILFTAPGKQLYALEPSGRIKWIFKTDGKLVTAPCVGLNNTIHVGASNGKVYAINPDGTKNWEFGAGPPQMSGLVIGAGGVVCFGTYTGELVVVDPQGGLLLRAPLVAGESSHFGEPAILADGTIVMSSCRAIHGIRPDGNKKWSYSFPNQIYCASPAVAVDDNLIIAAASNKLEAISRDGKCLWSIPNFPTSSFYSPFKSPTLSPNGALYAATPDGLIAVQCPNGLADSPWPMCGQNPQQTNRANPKFSQPIQYGPVERTRAAPVEIRPALLKPMPEKPFTKEEVLQKLDAAQDFPMLDNGYIYPATVRLSAFRDSLRWALVVEIIGWNNRSSGHEAIQNALYCYGNWLNQSPGLADDGFLNPTRDGDESCAFDYQDVDQEARTLYVRDSLVKIPRVRKHYASLGIKLEEPGVIKGHELLRALVAEHRDLFLASDEELTQRVGDLPLVLRLHEWRHPDVSAEEKPSQCETFQMIADALVSGDPARYQLRHPPNTHWKNWPMAGAL